MFDVHTLIHNPAVTAEIQRDNLLVLDTAIGLRKLMEGSFCLVTSTQVLQGSPESIAVLQRHLAGLKGVPTASASAAVEALACNLLDDTVDMWDLARKHYVGHVKAVESMLTDLKAL